MEVNMTKIMLVEDDKSLREIYGVRLLAEGYEIISAGDGEEALAMAVKEKPDLILSDVMMPKISGFDMLDILRSTPETKNIKVIMMTALSSEDQRARGETLGANRYLVKSQVGIEDVVRSVHDILADIPIAAVHKIERFGVPAQTAAIDQPVSVPPRPIAQPTQITAKPAEPTTQPAPSAQPAAPTVPAAVTIPPAPIQPTDPKPAPTPESTPPISEEPTSPTPTVTEPQPQAVIEPTPAPESPVVTAIPPNPTPEPETAPVPTPTPTELPQPTAPFSTAAPASLGDRVINPITPITPTPDIASLMNNELNDGSDTTPINPQP